MGSFLLFILLIFLLIIGLGITFIIRFLRLFTKGAKAASPFGGSRANQQSQHTGNSSDMGQEPQGKVFGSEEGEYVDYEEIK